MINTPIAVILFNRPVFALNLRRHLDAQHKRTLFVIVDGPRSNRIDDIEKVRDCIDIFSDWPGEVFFNISDLNMGCKNRVTTGLKWVFSQVTEAIILEDDLSPHPDFFKFCDQMLDQYENQERVMSVCGTKTYPYNVNSQIFFSRYNNCWGWATWKRAWDLYDDKFSGITNLNLISQLKSSLGNYQAAFYWLFRKWQVLTGRKSSWAYCWSISSFLNDGLHIYPNQNLVINQGFDDQSTHTNTVESYVPLRYGEKLSFPIELSTNINPDSDVDAWIDSNIFSKSLAVRIRWMLDIKNIKKIKRGLNI